MDMQLHSLALHDARVMGSCVTRVWCSAHLLACLQGALLLLLFQVSHYLEEKFTMRARGGLEHLFASIPSQVTLGRDIHPAAAVRQPAMSPLVQLPS